MHARQSTIAVAVTALMISTAAVAVGLFTPRHALAQAAGFDFSQPDVVATGLAIPWGLTFLPDGDALVVERATARVLRISPGSPPQQLGTVPNVDPDGEGGLLGLAVSPTFGQDGWVYAYHTSPSDNRVVRFQLGSVQSPQPVLTGIPRGTFIHNGGRIQFGPDGMLYASAGDAGVGANAQNLNSLAGKILRITPTGGVPADNPFPGSPVLSWGHRNVQGLAWDGAGRLWVSEFGQNALDEVNLIEPGGNYGWPECEGPCSPPDPGFIDPKLTWSTAEASPSGAAIANDHLFVTGLRGQRLWVVPLDGEDVGAPAAELEGEFGRLRTVEVGPDGWLWLTTSNRDGRGTPVPADDRIVRFPPTTPPPTTPPPTTPPPTTPPPTTPPPTTSPPPVGGDCEASYQVANQWPGGFQAGVTLTNAGDSTSTGWEVTWTFGDGQAITQLWNGSHDQVGPAVTVANASWNGSIGPDGSTSFGFLGSWNDVTNGVPTDLECTLQ